MAKKSTRKSAASPVGEKPVYLPRKVHILLGDTALGVRGERESHRAPADLDVGVVICALGGLGNPPHGFDAVEERTERHRAS